MSLMEKTVIWRGIVGYAATCKRTNTDDWMRGLERRLNRDLEIHDDPERMRFNELTGELDIVEAAPAEKVGDDE